MERCPKCHRLDVEYYDDMYRCLWRDCLFATDDYNEIKNAKHPIRFKKFRDSLRRKTQI